MDFYLTLMNSINTARSAIKKTFLDSAIKKSGGKEDKGIFLYTVYGSSGQVVPLTEIYLFFQKELILFYYPPLEMLISSSWSNDNTRNLLD